MTEKKVLVNRGTPPLLLLPARNYPFVVEDEHRIIEIPRKGRYVDIAPDIFTVEDGEFNIYDEETKIFYLPAITKVLFAMKKYPDLRSNQFFIPYVLELKDDKVSIVGQVIEMFISTDTQETEEV